MGQPSGHAREERQDSRGEGLVVRAGAAAWGGTPGPGRPMAVTSREWSKREVVWTEGSTRGRTQLN